MTGRIVGAAVSAMALALLGGWMWSSRRGASPRARNYRGMEIPVVLGLAAMAGGTVAALAWRAGGDADALVICAGTLVAAVAGFADDRWGGSERGFRGHLGGLRRGRLTTGILKIVLVVAAATGVVLWLGGSAARVAIGIVMVAAAANVANALDVRPGRAVKVLLPGLAASAAALFPAAVAVALGAYAGAFAGALGPDLRERGMLGDAGANPLGFLLGVGLYLALPMSGLVVALVVVLGLQVLAETVTLSRVIAAVPPLSWYDRLGRAREEKSSADSGPAA